MSDFAISVRGLGKKYRLGATLQHDTLRDHITHGIKSLLRLLGANSRDRDAIAEGDSISELESPTSDLWAVKDVSFDVEPGEIVGVIGRNGAGKSTLLKILSQVTEPTNGEVHVQGRIASLLEVGTGFHPELSGRENIFLNGAILGMSRAEIRAQFDEIVDFSGVERFLDTPVKRYSSGMYVRLAFAVAAHLDPEILIIDEVLAVGDAQFQQRCLGKMKDVAGSGRTVLLVSHNMAMTANLCDRAILLQKGTMKADGLPSDVIDAYLSCGGKTFGSAVWKSKDDAPGSDLVRMHGVRVCQDGFPRESGDVDISKPIEIELWLWNSRTVEKLAVGFWLLDKNGGVVFATNNSDAASLKPDPWYRQARSPGLYRSTCLIPGNFLNEGLHSITVGVSIGVDKALFLEESVISFTVHDNGEMRDEYYGPWIGVVRPRLLWNSTPASSEL